MSHVLTSSRRSALPIVLESVESPGEASPAAPWLAVVADSVKSLHYGVVQIVVHDSRVVQVERTERTRFDVPSIGGR